MYSEDFYKLELLNLGKSRAEKKAIIYFYLGEFEKHFQQCKIPTQQKLIENGAINFKAENDRSKIPTLNSFQNRPKSSTARKLSESSG